MRPLRFESLRMNPSHAATAAATPIDHAHLGRYTMGNRALELEVLDLFAGQAPSTLAELAGAETAKAWYVAAHTLKGSARAVGAFALATAAEEAEKAPHDDPRRKDFIAKIEQILSETCHYISALPRAAA